MSLAGAKEILLIIHGTGKSSALGAFTEHIDSYHGDLSKRIIGHIEADLSNLADSQLLALARDWFQAHIS